MSHWIANKTAVDLLRPEIIPTMATNPAEDKADEQGQSDEEKKHCPIDERIGFKKLFGRLESQHFPSFHSNARQCVWRFEPVKAQRLSLSVDVFEPRAGNEAGLTIQSLNTGKILKTFNKTIDRPQIFHTEEPIRDCVIIIIIRIR